MGYKVIILAVPGIGSHKSGFTKEMNDDILKFSKNTPLENSFSIVEALPFAETGIDLNQNALFTRLDNNNKLGGVLSFRKKAMEAFGDGVTFESGANKPNSIYKKVHTYLRSKVRYINELKEQNPDSKLVIIAASLGVHLISTYIWDADKNSGVFEENHASENENLKNLSHLFSIGCNIPLFISGKDETDIKPFDKRNPSFKWDNFYDKDDILGWPLADINNEYRELVKDHQINTGLYIGSHVKYWDDNDFTKPLVKKLIDLIS